MLLLASGAAWESQALDLIGAASGLVVLKRCVDTDDLMASATTGQAELAVVAVDAPGLDASAVTHLRRHGVALVAVTAEATREDTDARLARIGVRAVLPADELTELPRTLLALAEEVEPRGVLTPGVPDAREVEVPLDPRDDAEPQPGVPGRVIVVWGPDGAPGRTTLTAGIGGELARRGVRTLVVDADPSAALAQHLGVLDQVSGLLSASRLLLGGSLAERLPSLCRAVEDDLAVLTGLPRPDRRVEIRSGALGEVLSTAASLSEAVVVDVGSTLADPNSGPDDFGGGPLGLEALEVADEVVVVGSADPVGLARLARGLVELGEAIGDVPVRVVVNRMRSSLGWSQSDVAQMVEGFARVSSLHFLPDDRVGTDRALVAGRSIAAQPGSSLSGAVRQLVDSVHPESYRADDGSAKQGWFSWRRAGTTPRR
ncbi:AAA family ATPase [Nocardioides gilvus]|uniref:AAA family ATPase n=1 Tax=Nocardioides gilvus TaxID=1735589 RepID=UPI000D7482E5|nr:hypothetical protein [Nocardioides gilvus]